MSTAETNAANWWDRQIIPRWAGILVVGVLFGGLVADGLWRDQHIDTHINPIVGRDDHGPYRPDAGCPQRTWRIGEHLPIACLQGNGLRYAGVGQWTNRRDIWIPRMDRWARAGDDALLVAQPAFSGHAVIVQIAHDRFRSYGPSLPAQTGPIAPAPLDYVISYFINIAVRLAFVAFLFAATFKQWRKRPLPSGG